LEEGKKKKKRGGGGRKGGEKSAKGEEKLPAPTSELTPAQRGVDASNDLSAPYYPLPKEKKKRGGGGEKEKES